jgi:hypothetical protein
LIKLVKKMNLVTVDDEDQGRAIRFQTGNYAGETAWINKSQQQKLVKCHVIVNKGNSKGFFVTVDRKSLAEPFAKANCQLSFALQQVAKIEVHMNALCSTLVMCQITTVTPEYIELLMAKLHDAFIAHQGTKLRPSKRYDIAIHDADTIRHASNKYYDDRRHLPVVKLTNNRINLISDLLFFATGPTL